MFELLSKAVVESKQKVNIPKLSKEEPEEKEESEKAKREEERGAGPSNPIFISSRMHNALKKKLWVHLKWMGSQNDEYETREQNSSSQSSYNCNRKTSKVHVNATRALRMTAEDERI